MSVADQRAAVVAEAMTWLRTPYHHRQAVKGAGADCALFPIAVYKLVGVIPADFDPGYYPSDWAVHRDDERYLGFLHTLGKEIARDQVQPGDFAVWKYGRSYSHGAIVLEPPMVIHAYAEAECVTIDNMDLEENLRTRARLFFTLWQ